MIISEYRIIQFTRGNIRGFESRKIGNLLQKAQKSLENNKKTLKLLKSIKNALKYIKKYENLLENFFEKKYNLYRLPAY